MRIMSRDLVSECINDRDDEMSGRRGRDASEGDEEVREDEEKVEKEIESDFK